MGSTEGKNGSFMAIRMIIHQKVMFFLDPLVDLKKKTETGACVQISYCYVHIWCICYFSCRPYCGALVGCPGVSENKTLNSGNTSVVFFSCLKMFKCLGDVLDAVTPITVGHIEVPSFRRF